MAEILVCIEGCPRSKESPIFVALISVRADKRGNFIQGETVCELAAERFKCLYCGSNVRREFVPDRKPREHGCKMPGCRTNDPKVNKNYCRECRKRISEREKQAGKVDLPADPDDWGTDDLREIATKIMGKTKRPRSRQACINIIEGERSKR